MGVVVVVVVFEGSLQMVLVPPEVVAGVGASNTKRSSYESFSGRMNYCRHSKLY